MARPLLYAHRGAAASVPENTLASFERALAEGADAIETDAHMTADGHVVLSHDPTGVRMAGVPDEIRRTTLEEVQRWDVGWGFVDASGERPFAGQGFKIPTLAEALARFPEVRFNVDAKQRRPSMVKAIVDVVQRARAEERTLIASFHASTLRAVRALGYEGATGLGRAEVARLVLLPLSALRVLKLKGAAAQLPLHAGRVPLGTRDVIDKCHALGLRVDYWTVNDAEEARRLLALGADGVMTDDPRAIAPVFRHLDVA